MSALSHHLISGQSLFSGAFLVVLGVVLGASLRRSPWRLAALVPALAGFGLALASSAPVPTFVWICLGPLLTGWLAVLCMNHDKSARIGLAAGVALAAGCVGLALAEVRHGLAPELPAAGCRSICVIGDSISAGVGGREGAPWPELLATEHGVPVRNLSRAGSTVAMALSRVAGVDGERPLVILEIGGNDMIQGTPPAEFERDLARLVEAVQAKAAAVIMLELPLMPGGSSYGRAQRRVAGRCGVPLVPKRLFARVLTDPGNTLDDVHLSAQGHRRMAEMIWSAIGTAVNVDHGRSDKGRDTTEGQGQTLVQTYPRASGFICG